MHPANQYTANQHTANQHTANQHTANQYTANQCRIELEQDTVVVTPVRNLGELDSELFFEDVEGVLRLLAQRRARNVVIDLHRTDFFGSDAIHLFLKLYRGARENKGRLALCHASQNERDVLRLMTLDRIWPIFSQCAEAVEYVSAHCVEVLVVDDSEVDRCLVGGLLGHQDEFQVRYADSGRSALEHMRESLPDVVITDLVMPEMDGLELLSQTRQLYPLVPVILLTAHGNEMIAFRALEQGAASYVPKSRQAEKLVETVDRVLTRKQAYHAGRQLKECPAKVECTFYMENDPTQIRPLVDLIQHNLAAICTGDGMEQIRIGIALEEALLNAIYHGNLEITYQELSAANAEDSFAGVRRLMNERGRQPNLQDRRIVVDVHITSHTARFVIRDDGDGFDRDAVSQPAERCFELGENRGTMLMCALMDEVVYNDAGNQVTLIKVP